MADDNGAAPRGRASRRAWLNAGAVLLVAVVGAAVLVPRQPPGLRHDNVLNVLFDSRWVVGGVRTCGFAAGLYLLASIVVRVQRDQWLRQVGPADVETDRTIAQVTEDQRDLQDALDRANDTIDRLRHEYADLLAAVGPARDNGGPAVGTPADRGKGGS